MARTITARFDGSVIIPDRPLKLPVGQRLRIQVAVEKTANGRPPKKPRKIIGAGKFASGIADLATNKKHMEGFGRS
jgi:hypothetical protein